MLLLLLLLFGAEVINFRVRVTRWILHELSFAEFCRVLLLAFADRRLLVAVPRQELENRQATRKK